MCTISESDNFRYLHAMNNFEEGGTCPVTEGSEKILILNNINNKDGQFFTDAESIVCNEDCRRQRKKNVKTRLIFTTRVLNTVSLDVKLKFILSL